MIYYDPMIEDISCGQSLLEWDTSTWSVIINNKLYVWYHGIQSQCPVTFCQKTYIKFNSIVNFKLRKFIYRHKNWFVEKSTITKGKNNSTIKDHNELTRAKIKQTNYFARNAKYQNEMALVS